MITDSAIETDELDYGIDLLDGIRSYIDGYAGGPAIARELVQNADDAGAKSLTFVFMVDRLTVKNDSVFQDKDWTAIRSVASGSKRADAESTGTWGTGFISVYQLTDSPEVESAGRAYRLEPHRNRFVKLPTQIGNETVFHFPWRTTQTDTGERIGAEAWPPQRIAQFKRELIAEIYRVMPFLRHLKSIAVHNERNKEEYKVTRFCDDSKSRTLANGTRYESWKITIVDAAQNTKREEWWHFYRNRLPEGFLNPQGKPIKKPDYAIGFNIRETDLPGTLYNFLPTEVLTGFAFHINGDFFPSSNRKAILSELDHSEKSKWNANVLAAVGDLFAVNLDHIRDDSKSAAAFYRLLPTQEKTAHAFLQPIIDAFRARARETGLIKTTDDQWTKPGAVRWTDDSALRKLARDYLSGIAKTHGDNVSHMPRPILQLAKELGAQELKPADFFGEIRARVPTDTALANAHPILRGQERLFAVCDYVKGLSASDRDMLLPHLDQVPLCLATDGKLYNPITLNLTPALWCADAETRRLLPPGTRRLVDRKWQEAYGAIFKNKIPEFGAPEMVAYLREIAGDCDGRIITRAHQALNNRDKVRDMCLYLEARKVFEHVPNVNGLPLCLDENHYLHLIGKADETVYLADPDTRTVAEYLGLTFVAPEVAKDAEIARFLVRGGVPHFDPPTFVRVLADICPRPRLMDDAHPAVNIPERLESLYRYFAANEKGLGEEGRARLRALPFVLTQNGNLVAANAPLSLPPLAPDSLLKDVLDMFRLDIFVSSALLTDDLRYFFKQTLGIHELTLLEYIDKYVLDLYDKANDEDRVWLLHLVQSALNDITPLSGRQTLNKLRAYPLIRCNDDEYRQANEVYFPSDLLKSVFSSSYNQPHSTYRIVPQSANTSGTGNNEWHSLFAALGMKSQPTAADLVNAVREAVNQPPTRMQLESVQSIYNYLDQHWESYAADPALLHLKNLRWLPALDDNSRWFVPRELYANSRRTYGGKQVKFVAFPRQIGIPLRDFLGIQPDVPLWAAVAHVLWLVREQEPITPAMYRFLNERAAGRELDRLIGQPMIYNDADHSYWLPSKVFTDSHYAAEYGDYRLYMPLDIGNYEALFNVIGVRKQLNTPQDYSDLLCEISAASNGGTITDDDKWLVANAYKRLAAELDKHPDSDPDWLIALKGQPVVLTKDGGFGLASHLFFDDRPDLSGKFEDNVIPLAFVPDGARPLLERLDVRSVAAVVEARLRHQPEGYHDSIHTHLLQRLIPQFERIIAHYAGEGIRSTANPAIFHSVKVFGAFQIEVQYQFTGIRPIVGEVERRTAFYDKEQQRLYYVKGAEQNIQLACEIELILLGRTNGTLSFAIAAILDNPDRADTLLDRHKIRRFDTDQVAPISIEGAKPANTVSFAHEAAPGDAPADDPPIDEPAAAEPASTTSQPPLPSLFSDVPPRRDAPTTAKSDTPKPASTPSSATPAPKRDTPELTPEPEPTQPAFTGNPLDVPRIATDYNLLAEEYKDEIGGVSREALAALARDDAESAKNTKASGAVWDDSDDPDAHERMDKVCFVLSFQMRYEGYLPLTNETRALFDGQKSPVMCKTDDGSEFPLYLDWRKKVTFNDKGMLQQYFAAHNIPAGGKVYLEHEHGRTFRLYYKKAPHTVHNVRLAELDETGRVTYIVVEDMDVECETDEYVFRADKRLEDKPALFAEAYGKKSAFQTLVDVFEDARVRNELPLHQNEAWRRVYAIRMLAYGTIYTLLYERACFINTGDGEWGFDPARVLERPQRDSRPPASRPSPSRPSPATPASTPSSASHPASTPASTRQPFVSAPQTATAPVPVADPVPTLAVLTPQQHLVETYAYFRALMAQPEYTFELGRFREVYYQFAADMNALYRDHDAPAAASDMTFGSRPDSTELMDRLRLQPDDPNIGAQFRAVLRDLLAESARNTQPSPELVSIAHAADTHIWRSYIRPELDAIVAAWERDGRYAIAESVLALDPQDQQSDITRISRKREAVEFVAESKGADDAQALDFLREALRLDPKLREAHQLYDRRFANLRAPLLVALSKQIAAGDSDAALDSFFAAYALTLQYGDCTSEAQYVWDEPDKIGGQLIQHLLQRATNAVKKHSAWAKSAAFAASAARVYLALHTPDPYRTQYAIALTMLADAYYAQEQWVEAACVYQYMVDNRLVAADTEAALKQNLATCYEALGLYDEVSNILRTIKPSSPDWARKIDADNLRRQESPMRIAHKAYLEGLREVLQHSHLRDSLDPARIQNYFTKVEGWRF